MERRRALRRLAAPDHPRMTECRRHAKRNTAQSAAIPYRMVAGTVRILLVTSRMSRRWVVPKGMVEAGLTPAASAAKEAFEEGGVRGVVAGGCLGRYRYVKVRRGQQLFCTVQVFPFRVTSVLPDWPERRFRRRAWMNVAGACGSVRELDLQRILERFDRTLAAGRTGLHP